MDSPVTTLDGGIFILLVINIVSVKLLFMSLSLVNQFITDIFYLPISGRQYNGAEEKR